MGLLPQEDIEQEIKCKICFSFENPVSNINDLISPCKCKGTMKYVHRGCLKMWRFRGKSFENTKKCCQCGCLYVIKGETVPGMLMTFSLTVIFLVIMYFVGKLLIHAILDTSLLLIKDVLVGDGKILFGQIKKTDFCFKNGMDFELEGLISINMNYLYTFIFVLFYMITTYQNFFSMFNYIFTFWRLVQFNFLLDRALFVCMTLYYLKHLFRSFYMKTDGFFTYLLNYKVV